MSEQFEAVYKAWIHCRRRKRKSAKAQYYEVHLLDHLVDTANALHSGSWQPQPPVCFTVAYPKAREIHAAAFVDRVVHHYLVPQLEAIFEPMFIHDVYSNRIGKGTHAAVDRLQHFMRSQKAEGVFFLQLDVRNFFNTIDRRILFKQLQKGLGKALRKDKMTAVKAVELRNLCHTILRQDIALVAEFHGLSKDMARVPQVKRLGQAGQDLGLPIGNLTSQFFANVYLNALDQFIKHQLKCGHYLRYVDDFILLHHNPRQLQNWHQDIARFLQAQLGLSLKKEFTLAPVTHGADFLGYITRPHYRLVRRRVVHHFRDKLNVFAREHIDKHSNGFAIIRLNAAVRDQLLAVFASYLGHFKHANYYRILQGLFKQYSWLSWLFYVENGKVIRLWEAKSPTSFRSQISFFRHVFPCAELRVQKGVKQHHWPAKNRIKDAVTPWVCRLIIKEQGYLKSGLKRRCVEQIHFYQGEALCA